MLSFSCHNIYWFPSALQWHTHIHILMHTNTHTHIVCLCRIRNTVFKGSPVGVRLVLRYGLCSCHHTLTGTHTLTDSFWHKTVNTADCWINLPRHCSPLRPGLLGGKRSLSSSSVFSHFRGRTPSTPTYLRPPPLPNHLQLYLYCNCLGKQYHLALKQLW